MSKVAWLDGNLCIFILGSIFILVVGTIAGYPLLMNALEVANPITTLILIFAVVFFYIFVLVILLWKTLVWKWEEQPNANRNS